MFLVAMGWSSKRDEVRVDQARHAGSVHPLTGSTRRSISDPDVLLDLFYEIVLGADDEASSTISLFLRCLGRISYSQTTCVSGAFFNPRQRLFMREYSREHR